MQKQITHYPSRINFQRSTDSVVPLQWAISYLTQLKEAIPKNEQDDAKITWPPTITYLHTLTTAETTEERMQRIDAWINGLPVTGADSNAIQLLRTILGR